MNIEVGILIAAICVPLIPIGALSFVLHYFVALKCKPMRRAQWTAGLAYTLTALGWLVMPLEQAYYGPLASIPGGLFVFWFWKRDFEHAWVESESELADGEE